MTNQGQVITRFGAELIVETQSGELIRCNSRRKLDNIAAGDFVQYDIQNQGNAAVTQILSRKNVLERPDFRGKSRPLAANIDVLVVVNSWQPAPNWDLLDRYLIAAQRLNTDAIIVFNKADLQHTATEAQQTCLAEYIKIGYPILHINGLTGAGITDLQAHIKGKTAIVVGQSGVGKSSIAGHLLPQHDIKVGSISETGEGRHTTTTATLYRLPSGGNLIDSPGVRDFGLTALNFSDLQAGYPEFNPYLGLCRFNNCTHHHEPNCAIKGALTDGALPPHRYARYLTLLAGL